MIFFILFILENCTFGFANYILCWICFYFRIHDVVCTDHAVDFINHAVVCTDHVEN